MKTVAKTAACTMVPGGQMIVGAIDAADSKSAGEAVGDAAGPGLGAGGLGAGGLTGMAVEAGAAAAMSGQTEEPPHAASMGYGGMEGMPDERQVARCMGLTTEEYAAFTNPTAGEARQPTKAEMKRQQKLSKKVDMQRYQSCMMQAMSAEQ